MEKFPKWIDCSLGQIWAWAITVVAHQRGAEQSGFIYLFKNAKDRKGGKKTAPPFPRGNYHVLRRWRASDNCPQRGGEAIGVDAVVKKPRFESKGR